MHLLDSDIIILPHFALGCDIDTHWFKFIGWGDNFHNIRSRRDVIHSKTAISSVTKECNKVFKFCQDYLDYFILVTLMWAAHINFILPQKIKSTLKGLNTYHLLRIAAKQPNLKCKYKEIKQSLLYHTCVVTLYINFIAP